MIWQGIFANLGKVSNVTLPEENARKFCPGSGDHLFAEVAAHYITWFQSCLDQVPNNYTNPAADIDDPGLRAQTHGLHDVACALLNVFRDGRQKDVSQLIEVLALRFYK